MAIKKRAASITKRRTTTKRKTMSRALASRLKTIVKRGLATLRDEEVRTMRSSVRGRGGFGTVAGARGDLSRVDADPINGGDQPTFDND